MTGDSGTNSAAPVAPVVEWESLGRYTHTYRLKISGGWLYRYGMSLSDACMVFVPE